MVFTSLLVSSPCLLVSSACLDPPLFLSLPGSPTCTSCLANGHSALIMPVTAMYLHTVNRHPQQDMNCDKPCQWTAGSVLYRIVKLYMAFDQQFYFWEFNRACYHVGAKRVRHISCVILVVKNWNSPVFSSIDGCNTTMSPYTGLKKLPHRKILNSAAKFS